MIVQNKQGLCDLIVLVREDLLSLREGGGQESSSPVCGSSEETEHNFCILTTSTTFS